MSRRNIKTVSVIMVLLLALTGCASTKTQDEKKEGVDTKEATQLVVEENYVFRDVKGNEYEAELLPDVKKMSYKPEQFKDENGFKYYTDGAGNVTSKLGIDVSEYQPAIDWQQVKAAGIEFAIIRIGYRGYGEEGKLVEDAMYRQHLEGALNAGLEVSVYFFSQAISKEETLEEADFVLERVQGVPISYPIVFDTEEITYDTSRTEGLSRSQFTENCITFCDAVEEKGYSSMIYANMKWMAFTLELEKLENYAKWYADYEPVPQCPYAFQMWQYTESGSVPGIEGNVDLNVAFPS